MAHAHIVSDSDNHFIIDPITRQLTNSSKKTILMKTDHNSEQFTFELPRMVEGHDMSTCNKVEVHYININSKTRQQSAGIYNVVDFDVDAEDDTKVLGTWLVSRNATQYAGSLNFVIRFACVSEGAVEEYSWNTGIYTGITISDGICNTETVVEEYVDILRQWLDTLEEMRDSGDLFVITDDGLIYNLNEKLDKLSAQIDDFQEQVTSLENQTTEFEENVNNEVTELKEEITEFKENVSNEITEFKENVSNEVTEFKENINNRIDSICSISGTSIDMYTLPNGVYCWSFDNTINHSITHAFGTSTEKTVSFNPPRRCAGMLYKSERGWSLEYNMIDSDYSGGYTYKLSCLAGSEYIAETYIYNGYTTDALPYNINFTLFDADQRGVLDVLVYDDRPDGSTWALCSGSLYQDSTFVTRSYTSLMRSDKHGYSHFNINKGRGLTYIANSYVSDATSSKITEDDTVSHRTFHSVYGDKKISLYTDVSIEKLRETPSLTGTYKQDSISNEYWLSVGITNDNDVAVTATIKTFVDNSDSSDDPYYTTTTTIASGETYTLTLGNIFSDGACVYVKFSSTDAMNATYKKLILGTYSGPTITQDDEDEAAEVPSIYCTLTGSVSRNIIPDTES